MPLRRYRVTDLGHGGLRECPLSPRYGSTSTRCARAGKHLTLQDALVLMWSRLRVTDMRLCSGPGCMRAVPNDTRYCDACKQEHPSTCKSRWERSKTDPIMAQYGTPRWVRFRYPVIQMCPFCYVCKTKPSVVADHNIPARLIVAVCRELHLFPFDPWGGFYIRANMVGLCHSCHNKKTKTEDEADWLDELVRVLAKYMLDKGIPEAEHRARIGEAIAKGCDTGGG